MKKLQNSFTTPEQSKRLLELGVPADSADMIWDVAYDYESGWEFEEHPSFFNETYTELCELYRDEYAIHILPCWSAGRLMEICKICGSYELTKEIYERALMYHNIVEWYVCEMNYEIYKGHIDLSKLEE